MVFFNARWYNAFQHSDLMNKIFLILAEWMNMQHLLRPIHELKSFFQKNIKYKIFLMLSVIVSALILLFSIISYFSTTRVIYDDYINYKLSSNQQANDSLDSNMSFLVQQTYQFYNHYKDVLNVLTGGPSSPSYTQSYSDLHTVVQSIVDSSSNIYAFTLTDLEGNVIIYADKVHIHVPQDNIGQYEWFKDVFELNGKYMILPPHPNYFSNRYSISPTVISVASSLVDLQTNELIGTIMVDQNLTFFDELISNMTPETDEYIFLLDESHNIIYSNAEPPPMLRKEVLSTLQNSGSSASNDIVRVPEGDSMLLTYSAPSSFGWRIASAIPNSAIIDKGDFIKKINFTLLFFIIIASLGISILISSRISAPLKKLHSGFHRLEGGKFGTQLDVYGKDEMAQITAAFNQMSSNMEKMIKDQYLSEINLQSSQLEVMQNQINPHFLYNTLNIMKAHADVNGDYEVSKMIQSLAKIFRYSLSRGKSIMKMSDEIEHLRKYLYLQNIRFVPPIQITWRIDERALECEMLRFTLQPIAENIFVHGFKNMRKGCKIEIATYFSGGDLLVSISNNGILMADESLEKINALLGLPSKVFMERHSEKVGVFNVNSRIKLAFGDRYGLYFRVENNMTATYIRLPKKEGGKNESLNH
jgi:two-component system sensor histidine kinase YesM